MGSIYRMMTEEDWVWGKVCTILWFTGNRLDRELGDRLHKSVYDHTGPEDATLTFRFNRAEYMHVALIVADVRRRIGC